MVARPMPAEGGEPPASDLTEIGRGPLAPCESRRSNVACLTERIGSSNSIQRRMSKGTQPAAHENSGEYHDEQVGTGLHNRADPCCCESACGGADPREGDGCHTPEQRLYIELERREGCWCVYQARHRSHR